jgi:hypothetical protein
MIRPRDALAAILAQAFRATKPAERAAAKRLRREALATVDRAARALGDAPIAAATTAALRAQEIAMGLPAGVDRAAVLCAVVRGMLDDGDGILWALDAAVRDACAQHPLRAEDAHHVEAITRECMGAMAAAGVEGVEGAAVVAA